MKTLKQLIGDVARTQSTLKSFLSEKELRTQRRSGSEYPRTFEDVAAEKSLPTVIPRRLLPEYQAAVNALWSWVVEHSYAERIAKAWTSRHRTQMSARGASYDDVLSEVLYTLRAAIVKFDGTKYPGAGALLTYSFKVIYRELNTWIGRQGIPVELPTHVARAGGNRRLETNGNQHMTPDNFEDILIDLLDAFRADPTRRLMI